MDKLCVFDLDGTLVNTIADIAYAANHALEELGYPTCDEDSYRYKIGNGMRMICKRAMPEEAGEDEAKLDEMVKRYNAYYCDHCCDRSKTYPGILELIKNLRAAGVKCAVISNKPHPQTLIVLDPLFQKDDFVYVEGQSDRFPRKPDPTVLEDCMSRLGFTREQTFYVGDSDVDMIFANNAGVAGIGASWGFRGAEELKNSNAACVAETAQDIYDFVMGK